MGGGQSKPSPQVIVVKAPESKPTAPAPVPHTPETTFTGRACPVDMPYAFGISCIDRPNICPTGYRIPTLLESAANPRIANQCVPNNASFISYTRGDLAYNVDKVGSSCPEGSQLVDDSGWAGGSRCVRNCLPGTQPGPGFDCVPDVKTEQPDKPFYSFLGNRKIHVLDAKNYKLKEVMPDGTEKEVMR